MLVIRLAACVSLGLLFSVLFFVDVGEAIAVASLMPLFALAAGILLFELAVEYDPLGRYPVQPQTRPIAAEREP